ncbi:phosphonate ABC transporter ATP-binding protein [Uliginosibacterium sp. H1]|uniref:phosphonate ABC transporter ATP-binding protein n=1 Tax=Uliginosibacterium sp. H1 TaxID=3114757 RepID=UPI002E1907E1|nr:phosphonate ABC transporter ATP-binding protein [Uliginosibacterium sp. H1]
MIRVRQLSKRYGDNAVLRGVDLDAAAGEFVVVLGQSGAGKSTLLRCINRLVVPDAGELAVAGLDAIGCRDERALRRQVAMIFQNHHVVPRLSVLRNVLTGRLGSVGTLGSVLQFFQRDDVALAHECLARVGLSHKALERTDSLSGGQMQRVGIARALAQKPRVILADEPVASLDPATSRRVLQYLRDASRDLGITVLCNLHQVDYACEFGDRIVGLAHGRVVFDGMPATLGEADLARIYDDAHGIHPAAAGETAMPAAQPAFATAGA